MTPEERARWYSRRKLSGAEAAIVLALLFGPRYKHELYAELPHHRDTLGDALKSLTARGFVGGNYGRGRTRCRLRLLPNGEDMKADSVDPPVERSKRRTSSANPEARP